MASPLETAAPRGRPVSRVTLGLGTVLVAALTLAGEWPLVEHAAPETTAVVLVNLVITVGFVATGLLCAGDNLLARLGPFLIISGVLWALWWGEVWHRDPMVFVGYEAGTWFWFVLAHGVLAYPGTWRRDRSEKAFLWLTIVSLPVLSNAMPLLAPPARWGFSDEIWWPTVWDSPTAFHLVAWLAIAGYGASTAYFGILLRRRLRASAPHRRRQLVPVVVALLIASTATTVTSTLVLGSPVTEHLYLAYPLTALALAFVAGSFLTTGIRHRLARAKIVNLLARQRRPPTVESVRSALRQALRDDTVEVLFWLDARCHYVDGDARTVERLPDAADRCAVPVRSRSGEPLALILVHPATPWSCPLIEVTVSAARFALENVHLQAAMGAQLAELRSARTRVAELALRERRQLEQDLHDGAQQRLLGLAARLALARTIASDPGTRAALDGARAELREALVELREFARGINPVLLNHAGLPAAVDGLAGSLPIALSVDVPETVLRAISDHPAAETVAYLTIREALTNAAVHGHASKASVEASLDGSALVIDIVDDGFGGATVVPGRGLASAADRLGGLGGEASVICSRSGSTTSTRSRTRSARSPGAAWPSTSRSSH
ncbi:MULTISPECIES: sensor histidine kinase [Pseudofrankia]|uniref:sensor histidine kinase n=1 Tax=Pseudofrankia TaxID=2994363 RepID=UPI000234B686|nr:MULTISPECIES: histidine kinase [Pseudofrankia]